VFRVASVPYVNARPLVLALERFGWAEVVYAVPSQLPALLEAREVDAIMVSSFDALRTPRRAIAAGCAIASLNRAESVRLFSKVPFEEIRRLALDRSSLTSNHLALILLAEAYGVRPETTISEPDLKVMLKDNDACLVMGDLGLETNGDGLRELDLGLAWRALTQKPFVWALWVGHEDLSADLVTCLNQALAWGRSHWDEVIANAVARSGWTIEVARHYLCETMSYDLSPDHLAGLEQFRQALTRQGFVADRPMPRIVQPATQNLAIVESVSAEPKLLQ
jgi:chorismate dehydratase